MPNGVLMAFYECIFIARQDIAAPEVHKLADKFVEVFQEYGCKLITKEYWGLRNLTYVIKKNKKGHYIMLGIDGNSKATAEFERNCKINEDILKYMCIKVDHLDSTPSAMMQAPAKATPMMANSDDLLI